MCCVGIAVLPCCCSPADVLFLSSFAFGLNCLYCAQVLAKHFPGLKVHPDVHDLDLAAAVEGAILEVVIISTPCVDLSSRGLGQAQLGTVCSSAPPLVAVVFKLQGLN
jgi:DNA-binding transcriptional LysR family regulator